MCEKKTEKEERERKRAFLRNGIIQFGTEVSSPRAGTVQTYTPLLPRSECSGTE
jgi:hypothetical protein